MDLQGAGGREALPTSLAVVLLWVAARRCDRAHGGHQITATPKRGAQKRSHLRLYSLRADGQHGAVTVRCSVRIGGLKEVWWEVPHLVCEHVLPEIPLCGEAPAACCADEWSFLGVASVVDI